MFTIVWRTEHDYTRSQGPLGNMFRGALRDRDELVIKMLFLLTAKIVYILIFYSVQSLSCFSAQNKKIGLTRGWLEVDSGSRLATL